MNPDLYPAAGTERERAYSPSSCIGGDYRPFVEAYAERSRAARALAEDLGGRWIEGRYGRRPSQRLDLCLPFSLDEAPPSRPCPLLVFVHGGYWQELSAAQSLFAAARCIEMGVAFAAVDYTLAPDATLGDIVAECREAWRWLARQAPYQGIDPERMVVAGSSAGAHLAAMIGRMPHEPRGAAVPLPRAAVLVSGVYELEPLIGTSVNDALGLQPDAARRFSPLQLPLRGFPRAVLCWGAVETEAFKAQSRVFAAALEGAGTRCSSFEVPGRNHFDVILDLMEPGTRLGEETRDLLRA